MNPPRNLNLIERRPRLVRLAPDEVAHLLTHHRAHVALLPTPERHVWQVTPMGVVGVLSTPRRRMVIAPKIPLQTLLFLSDASAESPGEDRTSPTDADAFLDLLAGLLAARMLARARAGLHRAYRQTPTQGAYLVGALDLSAQLRQLPFRKDQLHGRLDDLTALLPCNLVPRRLAGLMLPLVGTSARASLEQAIAACAEIPDGPLSAELLAGLDAPDTPVEYRSLLELCRLLADSLAPSPNDGPTPAPALLISLERLFERHVIRGVVEAFTPFAQPQASHTIAGPPSLLFRPDVEVVREGRTVLVVDAKWKQPARDFLHNEDVYQILAYCVLLGCPLGVLVYPGKRRTWRHVSAAGITVEVRTLDVAGSPGDCLEARRRMGRALKRRSGFPA